MTIRVVVSRVVNSLKALILKEVPSPYQRTSKDSEGVFPPPVRVKSRRSSIMLLPSQSIMVWRDSDQLPRKETDPIRPRCVSILFELFVENKQLRIAMRRDLNEPFDDFKGKVLLKISKLLNPVSGKQKKMKGAANGVCDTPIPINVNFKPVAFEDTKPLLNSDVFCPSTSSSFLVDENIYRLIYDPIDISTIHIPLNPMVGCPCIPSIDYRIVNTSSNETGENVKPVLHWFVSWDDVSKQNQAEPEIKLFKEGLRKFSLTGWMYRQTSDIFIPTSKDIGRMVAVVCDLGEDRIVRAGFSRKKVEEIGEVPLYQERISAMKPVTGPENFRVVSYNVLADLYLTLTGSQDTFFFPYCPKEYQVYDYRYPLIMAELAAYDAHLLFLQEVDHRFQIRYLSCFSESNGFRMSFFKKAKEVGEGSAIMYKTSHFRLLSSDGFALSSLLSWNDNEDIRRIVESSEEANEIFSTRPTTVQIVILEHLSTGCFVVCANTHLHHKPQHEHIKVAQALVAVRKVDEIVRKLRGEKKQTRVIFGGDFNSTPGDSVYQLLSTGSLSRENLCWKLDEKIEPENIQLSPCWPNGLNNLTGTPEFTNYTRFEKSPGVSEGFAGCLDYVWSCDGVTAATVHPLPSLDSVKRHNALPAKHCPSDHLPLIVDVKL